MAGSGKLNLIWFRDQEPARRLRFRPGWLRALTYLLVLVLLAAAGGSLAAWELWRRAQEVAGDKRETEKRLSDALIKLERLQNIEKLLQTSDASELSQLLAGLGLESTAAKAAPAQPQKGGKEPKDNQGKESKDAARDSAKDAARDQPREPARPAPAGFDLAALMGRVDLAQVGVENFRFKLDAKGVQYGFDLSNLMSQALSGGGQLAAVTRDGMLVPLQTGKDDLSFNIQRFKQVQAQTPMPPGLDAQNLFGLRLTLSNSSGKIIFSETYPLAQTQ